MAINISSALSQPIVDKRIDILQRIDKLGSISKAARSAGVSYKAAWQAIEILTTLAGEELIEKSVGGADGGGAKLTEAGKEVLRAAEALQEARVKVLSEFESGINLRHAAITSAAFRMSARNIIPCKILGMHGGKSQIKVNMEVCIGNQIKASVTVESAQLLGLEVGMEVLAIFKATACQVYDHFPEEEVFFLGGTVVSLPQKDRGGEVSLSLPNGIVVVGFAHSPHQLKLGSKAYITVPEQNIIIGLA